MSEFILDVNTSTKPGKKNHPHFLYSDIARLSRIKLVRGGKGYGEEVKKNRSLLLLFIELEKAGKVRRINDAIVDSKKHEIQKRINEKFKNCPKECDDFDIFALSLISSCNNIVTFDARMAKCRSMIRNKVGHNYCPNLKIIKDEATYILARDSS